MSLNGVPTVMYAKDSFDFTNDVVTALNKPGANPAPKAVATPVKK